MDPTTDNGLQARDLDRRESGNLIGSDKVEGTAVYSLANDKIGVIERVMIDKLSGKVGYAVLSFGGFLGIGDDHYPIPWAKLTYDETIGGYRTDISKRRVTTRTMTSNGTTVSGPWTSTPITGFLRTGYNRSMSAIRNGRRT